MTCAICTVATVGILLSLTGGCQHLPSRINHIHSETNQKRAEKNLATFQEFTSDTAGLPATLLKNLSTQTALARTVARNDLVTAERGALFTAVEGSWDGLRGAVFKRVGLRDADAAAQARSGRNIPSVPVADVKTNDYLHSEFEKRLEERMTDVTFICASLTTLVDLRTALVQVETAKVKQAEGGLSNLLAKLEGKPSTSATNPPDTDEDRLWNTLVGLEKAISDAYNESIGTNTVRRAELYAQAKVLADLIDQERKDNLATLKALVPVVNSGLDSNSLNLLHHFSTNLAAKVNELSKKKEVQSKKASAMSAVQPSDPWQKHFDLMFERNPKGEKSLVLMAMAKKMGIDSASTTNSKKWLGNFLFQFPDDLGSLANATRDLRKSVAAYDKQLGLLQTIAATTNKFRGEALAHLAVEQVLKSSPRLQRVWTELEKNKEAMAYLNSLTGDINRERQAAVVRLAELFAQISRTQLDFHEEMLRHNQSVLAVAQRESRRWSEIGFAWTNIAGIFLERGTEVDTTIGMVFHTGGANALQTTANRVGKIVNLAGNNVLPPTDIGIQDSVLASLRLLAENAQAWQNQSPRERDPGALATRYSNVRLTQAVTLLHRTLFLLSFNRREAGENAIQLGAEVSEHDIHLQCLRFRTDEALVRFELKELLAFHQSGWTQTDAQNLFSIAQSVLLAWIGTQQ